MTNAIDEQKFNDEVEAKLSDIEKSFEQTVTIAIIGKVSAGKSSLLNALFNRNKNQPLASVGATSGVTTKVKHFELGKNIHVIDSPGLGDVIDENSDVTKQLLSNRIDVGILVVSDSADATQKQHYDDLKESCKKVFVVLNKIDLYDKKKAALENVTKQWHEVLGLESDEKIFQTCADGYDPDSDDDIELDIRGVDELRISILDFLKAYGKDLLLAREMEKKSVLAKRAIYTCMVAVAGFAFIPGSAMYITGAQAVAIMSIHYIYTGEVISKASAIAAIPLFASQSIGSNLFLVIKSLLPPTGVLDVAAAGVAMGVTLAMLSTVNWMYENGYNFDNKSEIKEQYDKFYEMLKEIGLSEIFNIVKAKDKAAIMALIARFIKD